MEAFRNRLGVLLGRRVACAILAATMLSSSAVAIEPFTEEAVARGISYQTVGIGTFGVGVAFVDLDSDGDPDIVAIGRADGQVGILENDGTGNFIDRSIGSGIPNMAGPSGIAAGDYDGDGRLDLYFSNWGVPNVLVHNDASFTFTDVTGTAGVGDSGFGTGCTWGDFNSDGDLDLYLANRSVPTPTIIPNRLFRNEGNGTFVDVAASLGVDLVGEDEPSFQAVFFDMDNDADADLYISTDKGATTDVQNRLFRNDGGSFLDVSVFSGANLSIDSMGVGVGDFDGNGFQDLYCTNTQGGNKLLLNDGLGSFAESSALAGVESFTIGWGAAFFDFDNDGFLDLYVCDLTGANQLYEYDGSWPATNMAGVADVDDPGQSFGIAIADIDDDGDIDILVQDNDELLKLYINHEGQLRHWIKFDVVGEGHNRLAIGAQVRIRVGSDWQMREILAGGNNYKSQNELIVHFGLGDATFVDEVRITWPGGTTSTLHNLSADRTWQIGPSTVVPAVSPASLLAMVAALVAVGTVVFRTRSRV